MPIEASFSLRQLHQLCLEGNGPVLLDFMDGMVPNDVMNLRSRTILKVIRSHLVARGVVLALERSLILQNLQEGPSTFPQPQLHLSFLPLELTLARGAPDSGLTSLKPLCFLQHLRDTNDA